MGQILFEYWNLEYNRGPTHTTTISILDNIYLHIYSCKYIKQGCNSITLFSVGIVLNETF